jgi:hypothetical protein
LCAAFYLAGVWLEGVGWGSPIRNYLPHWIGYFMQVAALFPRSAHYTIDYRAEAYVCDSSDWQEMEVRPYFPIDMNDKESRFQRVMFFYRTQKTVMAALDHFLVTVHSRGERDDGIPSDKKIGGVRLLSIRGPLPNIGDKLVPFHHAALPEVPSSQRKVFYQTSSTRITERCFGKHPHEVHPKPEEDHSIEPPSESHPNDDPSDPRKEDLP